ncbi:hypothetical protein X975_07159, partial [Stegodyphus mimosarum]
MSCCCLYRIKNEVIGQPPSCHDIRFITAAVIFVLNIDCLSGAKGAPPSVLTTKISLCSPLPAELYAVIEK